MTEVHVVSLSDRMMKLCGNVDFGSKHGGLLRNSHRICKYLIHLWTHCSLQREVVSFKLCFKHYIYTEPYAMSEQIVTSNVWKLKQHMEEVLEVLMLPNVLTLLLCSGMLIGPTQTLLCAASWFFPSFNFYHLLSFFITCPAVLHFTNEK